MSTALTRIEDEGAALAPSFSSDQIQIIRSQLAPGVSDGEFEYFMEVCRSTGLNPIVNPIYPIVRQTWNQDTRRKEPKMSIQTGIDGYRLIASRTGRHAGTTDPEFGPVDAKGNPEWARVTVRRLVSPGLVADFTATARWREYVQADRDGKASGLWAKMPFTMLGKCSEALALRKAFPAEMSGIYTREEMMQADTPDGADVVEVRTLPTGKPDGADVARLMYGGPEHNPPPRGRRTDAAPKPPADAPKQRTPAAEYYLGTARYRGVTPEAFKTVLDIATEKAGGDEEAALAAVRGWVEAGDYDDPTAVVAHLSYAEAVPVDDEPPAFMATATQTLFAEPSHRDEG